VSRDIAAIVAMLSVENVFYTITNLDSNSPADKVKIKSIKRRKRLMAPSSDHLSLLNVYREFVGIRDGRQQAQWCQEYLLNFKSIQKAVQICH
jgi:HrpA-like RNA helicase